MAGDWIKVEKITPDKPEIAILARELGISQADAFLSWFRAYSWADGITADGFVPNLSLADGDSLSRCCPGTFRTLASPILKWVEETPGGLIFSKWNRHNGKSAKNRALEADKKRRQRSVSRFCPDDNGTKSGPEKRRVSSSKKKIGFVPPTLEEVKAYCLERRNNVNPEKWLNHYKSNGWRVGKCPMKDWKAAIVTWETNDFDSRPILPSDDLAPMNYLN